MLPGPGAGEWGVLTVRGTTARGRRGPDTAADAAELADNEADSAAADCPTTVGTELFVSEGLLELPSLPEMLARDACPTKSRDALRLVHGRTL